MSNRENPAEPDERRHRKTEVADRAEALADDIAEDDKPEPLPKKRPTAIPDPSRYHLHKPKSD